MDDRLDAVLLDEPFHERRVAGIALDEGHALRHRPAKARGEVVEHDRRDAAIQQVEDHMAADITGAAGNEDRHQVILWIVAASGLADLGRADILCR